MEHSEYLNKIRSIDSTNEFLEYIVERVLRNDYRGIQISQHNRLTFLYFEKLIESIFEVAGNDMFRIHVGDDEGELQPEAETYYKIVETVKKKTGKGTINSIKKNTFPDIAKMGFIYRYDKEKNLIDEYGPRKGIYYVRLTTLGIKFISMPKFERIKSFSDGIDHLVGNLSNDLAEFLSLNEFNINYIDISEFMYIISDQRPSVTWHDKLRYLISYRKLKPVQKEKLDQLLKLYCNPSNLRDKADKTLLRDYSNWKNESQQIFGLFRNSAYFKVIDNRLALNDGELGVFYKDVRRTIQGKNDYYKYHKIKADPNFEFHHIVPFSKAKNQMDLNSIDNFKNLIYILNTKHAEFNKFNNDLVKLKYTENSPYLVFEDFYDNYLIVNLEHEVKVNKSLIPSILDYNKSLLKTFYYYH